MNTYLQEMQEVKEFLYGQIELYKIEFAETGNNKYLDVMNKLNKVSKTVKKMDEAIVRLNKENKELKNK